MSDQSFSDFGDAVVPSSDVELSGEEGLVAETLEPVRSEISSIPEQPAAFDHLGFALYVEAMANFLLAPNTRPPLTVSIEGSWGSGKSSFMLQLKRRLISMQAATVAIDFNAWKYDKQEELWAAFALKVARSLREQIPWTRRWQGDFELFRARIKGWNERLKLLALLLVWGLLFIGFAGVIGWTLRATYNERVHAMKSLLGHKETPKAAEASGKTEVVSQAEAPSQPLPEPWYNWLSWSPLATAVILIVALFGKIPESLRSKLFEARLEKYIDKPDYKGKAAFVDTFADDFTKMIKAYAPRGDAKIFVFVDDLDRCEAPKAADIMQAINLMIGEGGRLFFILGLDRPKVVAAVAYKFRDVVPYLPSVEVSLTNQDQLNLAASRELGDSFLEKFINIAFRVPVSSNRDLAREYVRSLIRPEATYSVSTISQFRLNLGLLSLRFPFGRKIEERVPRSVVDTPKIAPSEPEAGEEPLYNPFLVESGPESERIENAILMVGEVLGHSPRRIKSFLNNFRLAIYLADRQGLFHVRRETGRSEVTIETLAKFLAVTTRHPELWKEWLLEPDYMKRLENSLFEGSAIRADWADRWLKKPGMWNLLLYGLDGSAFQKKLYSLEDFPIQKFDTVLPAVPRPRRPNRPSPSSELPENSGDEAEEPEETAPTLAGRILSPQSGDLVPFNFTASGTLSPIPDNVDVWLILVTPDRKTLVFGLSIFDVGQFGSERSTRDGLRWSAVVSLREDYRVIECLEGGTANLQLVPLDRVTDSDAIRFLKEYRRPTTYLENFPQEMVVLDDISIRVQLPHLEMR